LIDGWLEADREAPRKQRHTAKRVWQRLVDEHGAEVAETTVRDYVRGRKRAMGWPVGEVFVPQVHDPGMGAEVDWGEAEVDLAGVRTTIHLFFMRPSFSGAAFCQASLVETQQAFLELHVEAFEWFGGVFAQIRYDNLTSAVKQVLKGRRRVESDRFVALRSHYLYAAAFTRPGIEGAHEKGGVEGEVGRFRRNHLVPVPAVGSLAELNVLLLEGCERDLARRIVGRSATVGEAWAAERPLLRPLRLAGLRVSVRIGAREITVTHGGELVASHERLQGRYGTSATLDHYLELLERKPGGLQHSLALRQERERGGWPGCFDELWAALAVRYGSSEAARQMVDVLLLSREHDPGRVELAVQGALAAGAHDGRAVAVLARRADATGRHTPAPLEQLEPRLAAHARPAPGIAEYNQLIGGSR
jgi:transposase